MTPSSTVADAGRISAALERVIDPELGISIVDLGLVYRIEVDESAVFVDLGVTTPTCPYSSQLAEDVAAAVTYATAGGAVDVALVFDPPWSPEMLSDRAREQLSLQPSSTLGLCSGSAALPRR